MLLAYVGFDAVCTTAEEAINPNRDLPIGIVGSLLISIVLYCGVAGTKGYVIGLFQAVVTLMQPYYQLDLNSPLSEAFSVHGLPWAQSVVAIGAFAGIYVVFITHSSLIYNDVNNYAEPTAYLYGDGKRWTTSCQFCIC